MSVTGAEDWEALSEKDVFDILSVYSQPRSRRFDRRDLWGKTFDVSGRFLREISRIFGRMHDSSRIDAFSRAERRVNPQNKLGPAAAPAILKRPPPHLSSWVELFHKWRAIVVAISKSPISAMGRVLLWLDEEFADSDARDPGHFLSVKRKSTLLDHIYRNRALNGQNQYSSTTAIELGEIFRFSEFIAEYTGLHERSARIYHLVSRNEIKRHGEALANTGNLNSSGEVSSIPLPPVLYALFQNLLSEGERGWPGTHRYCRYFLDGEDKYCPVLPALFLLSFELPGRFMQLVSLDSGEGDDEQFDGYLLSWKEKNESPHRGYWQKHGDSSPHGYARRTRNPNICGFFFNTNKTGKPFVVPWQNEAAHNLCQGVRDYVEKWVPISVPLSARDYRKDLVRSDELYFEKVPAIFPLFRLPANGIQKAGFPPHYVVRREFWIDAMLEVQLRYNDSVPPEAALHFVSVDARGKPVRCDYMPHGMRSAGITRLLREGVSIAVVSKLIVGHAGILMTSRYNINDPAELSDLLEGNRLARSPQRGNLSESMQRLSFEEASRRTVAGSEDALKNAYGARNTWVERDVGLCPWMGQRCGDGGECIRRDIRNGINRSVYKSLDEGNCLVCRHLITDPSYIEGIYAKMEGLSRRLTVLIRRYNETANKLFNLEKRCAEEQLTAAAEQEINRQRRQLEVDLNDNVQAQTVICETIASGQRYIEQLRLLEKIDDVTDVTTRKIIHPDNSLVEWSASTARDEWVFISDFEHLTRIVHKSEFFTSVYDPEAEVSFKLLLDRMIVEAGYRPISLNRRSEAEQRQDYLRASELILNNISRQQLIALEDGTITPNDLGFSEVLRPMKLTKVSTKSVKDRLNSAQSTIALTLEMQNEKEK